MTEFCIQRFLAYPLNFYDSYLQKVTGFSVENFVSKINHWFSRHRFAGVGIQSRLTSLRSKCYDPAGAGCYGEEQGERLRVGTKWVLTAFTL